MRREAKDSMQKVYLVTRTRMAGDVLYRETMRIYKRLDKAIKYVASATGRSAKVLREYTYHGNIDVTADDGCTYTIEENILE